MEFLVIDDDKVFRDAACLLIEEEGHQAQPAGNGAAALAALRGKVFDAALLDVRLGTQNGLDVLPQILQGQANLPVIMLTAEGRVETAVEAMKRGALDFLEKPFRREHFQRVLARVHHFNKMSRSIERLEREVSESKSQHPDLLLDFQSFQMREIMEILARAARSEASVLLLGESGTGKSALARVVHSQSRCNDGPFVTVSCPSLSKELLESELFGHVRGAFTGAVKDRWGKVRAATGGTLFLDEVGDLPMEIQPKLLRLLQERDNERLGENVTRQAEVRVIAATNRNLKQKTAEGAFREDLYFRLNVIAVEVPPLRKRPDDVLAFAGHYLKHFARTCGRPITGFSDEAAARIKRHSWPGNLRELRNAIERAIILTSDNQIEAADLPIDESARASHGDRGLEPGDLVTLEELEDSHIQKVIQRTGNVAEAARILGIDDGTIYRRRKKMGIPPIRS